MTRNTSLTDANQLFTQALTSLLLQAQEKGFQPEQVNNIRLIRRTNGAVGPHVHAAATVKTCIFAEANATTPSEAEVARY